MSLLMSTRQSILVQVSLLAMMAVMPARAIAAGDTPPRLEKDIPYRSDADDQYARDQCKLDLYLPTEPASGFPLMVWFHGGGLTSGTRSHDMAVFKRLNDRGIAVASIGYRLSPKVKYPTYLQDAAKAVAWCMTEGVKRGADPKKIFVSGHSAGGYITTMLAMDERLLKDAGVPVGSIAGYIPISGQMLTHYTIREERGIQKQHLIADDAAPVYHVRKDAPPMLILVGDKDMAMRVEENQLFVSAMKDGQKNQTTSLLVVKDRDHGTICSKLLTPGDEGGEALLAFVAKHGGAAQKQ